MTPATPAHIAALIDRYSGRSGGNDAETIITWSKGDTVTVWSTCGADIARILRRCGSGLLDFREFDAGGGSIRMTFRADDVRGPEGAFKPRDVDSKPFPRDAVEAAS